MRTNTNEFEFSHGRKPKGFGYWALELTGTDGQGRYTSQTYFESGNLAEVKKAFAGGSRMRWAELKP